MSWIREQVVGAMNRMLDGYSTSGTLKKYMISMFIHHFPGQMTCAEFDEFMADYLDGSLSTRQQRKFDFHLDACPMCRTHLSEYRMTVDLAQSSAEDAPTLAPQELVNAIFAARDRDQE